MQFRYYAVRNIAAGHTVGVQYTVTLSITGMEHDPRTEEDVSVAMNGNTQAYVHRIEDVYNLTTNVYEEGTTAYGLAYEFLRSCMAREQFEVDLQDGAGFQNCIMEGPYKPQRYSLAGEWQFNFSIRILP